MDEIGARVRELINAARVTRREVASVVGLSEDAMSRSLSGARRFTSIELARIADRFDADLHWLITGQPDPNQLVVAARHSFDKATGQHTVPGRGDDAEVLAGIQLAYQQAYPQGHPSRPLPVEAAEARVLLGDGFVAGFADRIESRLDVDVCRVETLSTAYSFSLRGRHVIVIPKTGNWFRDNWNLAHELGHLVLGHHASSDGTLVSDSTERAANSFAADLLLPADELQQVRWESVEPTDLAVPLWNWGVSTHALAIRLQEIVGAVPELVRQWEVQPTQRLMRAHLPSQAGDDVISSRMAAAAARRFPVALLSALEAGIVEGRLGPGTLAWILAVDPQELEYLVPDPTPMSTAELAAALGF